MSKFKIGDRVKMVREVSEEITDVAATVREIRDARYAPILIEFDEYPGFGHHGNYGVRLDETTGWHVDEADIELIAKAGSAFKVEAGKFYTTRDGRKVGPMEPVETSDYYDRAYTFKAQRPGHEGKTAWLTDGRYYAHKETHPEDLISEWVEEPATPKVGDFVRFGDGGKGVILFDDGSDVIPYAVGHIGPVGGDRWGWFGDYQFTVIASLDDEAPAAANDNYEPGDIVEIVDTDIFSDRVAVGDLASVLTNDDGEIEIKVVTATGPLGQCVTPSFHSAIRRYKKAA